MFLSRSIFVIGKIYFSILRGSAIHGVFYVRFYVIYFYRVWRLLTSDIKSAHHNCISYLHIKSASSEIGGVLYCTLNLHSIAADGLLHIKSAHLKRRFTSSKQRFKNRFTFGTHHPCSFQTQKAEPVNYKTNFHFNLHRAPPGLFYYNTTNNQFEKS
jgi:hypothetical protein